MSQSPAAAPSNPSVNPSISAVLARFDRSSPEQLLTSLAAEIVRLSRDTADLAARLHALEQLGSIADRLLPPAGAAATAAELPRSVLIDAGHSLLDGNGFYPLEFDAVGNPCRWTGPGTQFSLQFFIDRRTGGKFKLSFTRFAAQVPASFLRCLLDGKPAECSVNDLRGSFEISGALTPRADPGATLLTFVVPATAAPAQLGQSADVRQLGLCFQKLTASSNPAADERAPPAEARAARKPRPAE